MFRSMQIKMTDLVSLSLVNGPGQSCPLGAVRTSKLCVYMADLLPLPSRLTLDIIGPTAVGRDFESLTSESNPIADAFLELLRPEVRRLVFLGLHFTIPERIIRLLPLQENSTLNEIGGYLKNVCSDIIREKKGGLEKKGQLAEHDILSRIIETGEFTDDEVSNQMVTFLAAGVRLSVPILSRFSTS